MTKILFAWLGLTDIKAASDNAKHGEGPILRALKDIPVDEAVIINDSKLKDVGSYCKWLSSKVDTKITEEVVTLTDPNDFTQIYENAMNVLNRHVNASIKPVYHLSPGTPSMMATWVLISASIYPAELIQSSKEHGVKIVTLPFEISSEYRPTAKTDTRERITSLLEALPPDDASFKDILFRSDIMKECTALARHIAPIDVSVLLLGETGTGKELFAKAIHHASERKNARFVPVNCSAIPETLFESEFFGYKKGAFTGAATDKKGHFEAADGGTLFLDEIGDMPLNLQAKLLRALESRRITPVGGNTEIEFNVRVIAATNRDLIMAVGTSEFRSDLFHRISHGIIKIPPLRERGGDISFLIDDAIARVSKERLKNRPLSISPKAKQRLINYSWPGNVRELYNTVARAAIWSTSPKLSEDDVRRHLVKIPERPRTQLSVRIGEGFNVHRYLDDIKKELLTRAENQAGGNASKAARLLGLDNYQTFNNWKKKVKI